MSDLVIRLGLTCALFVLMTACSSPESAEQIRRDGEAQVERHRDSPLIEILVSDQWTPLGDLRVFGREKNNDAGQIFGRVGVSPTEFRRSYALVGDDTEAALDEAAAQLVERGANLDRSIPGGRYLSAESQGERLSIEVLVLDVGRFEMNQRTTIG